MSNLSYAWCCSPSTPTFYIFSPISLNRSSRYSPAVMFVYDLGCFWSMHDSKVVRSISPLGCKKNGTEKREFFMSSRGGFTTRCVVDLSLLLVKRCSISPTFTTISSALGLTAYHVPSRVKTSSPSALAPINSVIRLISSCAPARTASSGKLSGSTIGK